MIERMYRVHRDPDARDRGASMGKPGAPDRPRPAGPVPLRRNVQRLDGRRRGRAHRSRVRQTFPNMFANPQEANATLRLLWAAVGSGEAGLLATHKTFSDTARQSSGPPHVRDDSRRPHLARVATKPTRLRAAPVPLVRPAPRSLGEGGHLSFVTRLDYLSSSTRIAGLRSEDLRSSVTISSCAACPNAAWWLSAPSR